MKAFGFIFLCAGWVLLGAAAFISKDLMGAIIAIGLMLLGIYASQDR